jgi:hypothetical protein
VIPFLGIYTKEHKSGYNRDICMPMFIAALFMTARPWKQPRHLDLMNGSRKCEMCDNIMGFYLAIKKNDTMWFEGK